MSNKNVPVRFKIRKDVAKMIDSLSDKSNPKIVESILLKKWREIRKTK